MPSEDGNAGGATRAALRAHSQDSPRSRSLPDRRQLSSTRVSSLHPSLRSQPATEVTPLSAIFHSTLESQSFDNSSRPIGFDGESGNPHTKSEPSLSDWSCDWSEDPDWANSVSTEGQHQPESLRESESNGRKSRLGHRDDDHIAHQDTSRGSAFGSDGLEYRRSIIMPSNTGLPRQAPGNPGGMQQQGQMPAQVQSQQQANGIGVALPNGLPHSGHQTDINYLWGVVQELSDALARNREQTAALVSRVQGLNGSNGIRAADEGAPQDEHVNGDTHGNAAAETASLRSQLHQSHTALAEAQAECLSLASMNDDYVTFLHGTMDKLRTYAQAHSTAIIAVHAHYNALLEQEREANMQLRIEHGEWQRGLGRAADFARKALRERSEEVGNLERKMREVRAENRVLRSLLGWHVDDYDSDDEPGGQARVAGADLG